MAIFSHLLQRVEAGNLHKGTAPPSSPPFDTLYHLCTYVKMKGDGGRLQRVAPPAATRPSDCGSFAPDATLGASQPHSESAARISPRAPPRQKNQLTLGRGHGEQAWPCRQEDRGLLGNHPPPRGLRSAAAKLPLWHAPAKRVWSLGPRRASRGKERSRRSSEPRKGRHRATV